MLNVTKVMPMADKQQYRVLCKELLEDIKEKLPSNQLELNRLKFRFLREHRLEKIPTNADLLAVAVPDERKQLHSLLSIKPIRLLSGVTVVAIMAKPLACKHGKCTYCPGGPGSVFGDVPQSYTGTEPATRRAVRNQYDPYLQVANRIEQYLATNKKPEKTELIIMGGTFPSFPRQYRHEFITYALKAMNDLGEAFFEHDRFLVEKFNDFFMLPGDIASQERTGVVHEKLLRMKHDKETTLETEQKRNETAAFRCVGMTIETRPDYGKLEQGNDCLGLGATRIELGIQTPYDDVHERTHRCHSTADSKESIRILKDLGFKINMHVMLGLPGVDKKRDLAAFKEYFENPDYRPDMLKIYPCLVVKGTVLYEQWKKGTFRPITTEEAAELTAEAKQYIPRYCRVMRVQRDIPSNRVDAGVQRTNLRQYVGWLMEKKGVTCRCIRCREAGIMSMKKDIKGVQPELHVEEYKASSGKEFFISFEDKNKEVLFGFCRMRFPSQQLRPEITKNSALLRELHVYGEQTPLGAAGPVQHLGLGKMLLSEAEKIAKQNGRDKMVVISGIGVREYYRKLGYRQEGPYVVKRL